MTEPAALRTVVLVSGTGTNLQALLDAQSPDGYAVVAVGSDRHDCGGLARAAAAGIPTFVVRVPDFATRPEWDRAITDAVAAHTPDLVVSAGFFKVLGADFLATHQTINTHPSLLPSFPGSFGVRDALAHGVRVTGCTCHWIDAGIDSGPIIEQRAVRVEDGDTEETLHERIKVAERAMLVDVVRALAADRGSWRHGSEAAD